MYLTSCRNICAWRTREQHSVSETLGENATNADTPTTNPVERLYTYSQSRNRVLSFFLRPYYSVSQFRLFSIHSTCSIVVTIVVDRRLYARTSQTAKDFEFRRHQVDTCCLCWRVPFVELFVLSIFLFSFSLALTVNPACVPKQKVNMENPFVDVNSSARHENKQEKGFSFCLTTNWLICMELSEFSHLFIDI